MEEQNKKEILSLQESQKASLNVLIKFAQICKENNFRYFLMYGTLIGAIRHNGFIPWDDDIDVMMPREDFDLFLKYAEDNKDELYPFKLHNRANTQNYYYGIPRFSDMTYKYIKTDNFNRTFDIGVFIDIYPWDNYCNNPDDGKKLLKKCIALNMNYVHYANFSNITDNLIKSVIRKCFYVFLRASKGNNYSERIDSIVREYIMSKTSDNDKFLGHIVFSPGVIQFEKSKLMDLASIPHEFSGHTFNIPAAYDYILRTLYGDYMQLPPEKDRHPTHDYYIIKR